MIICSYNRKKLVPRAIDSALAQEGVDLEVIVVDDCSDDGTFEYLRERYGSRVKVARTKVNSGVSTATNIGYQESAGQYIALLGDDDYWEDPRKLEKQLMVMEDNPRIGVSGTWWIELREGGERVEKTPTLSKSRYFLKERMLAGGGVVCGSTPLITRQAWDAVGGMDEKQLKGTDSDLFRRVALSGFDVNVLRDITTVVDVSHGLARMTPVQTRERVKKALNSHWHITKKYYRSYLCHPRALAVRLRSMIKLAIKYVITE